MGYAPLMALRAHEGDATQALAALRRRRCARRGDVRRAGDPGDGGRAREALRDLGGGAARARAASRVARVAFPTPDGWFEPGRREETVAPLAARRLIADRARLACGLTLRGLDLTTNRGEGRDEARRNGVVAASAPSAMAAAEASGRPGRTPGAGGSPRGCSRRRAAR